MTYSIEIMQVTYNTDADWTTTQIQYIFNLINKLFNFNLLAIGDQQVSLASVLQFVIQGIIVLLISRWVKQLLKRRILTRFGFDLGTRES